MYVLFLAESGARKGPPVNLSETLLSKAAVTKVISGRSSVQAILDELARAETDKKTGKITKAGSAIFYASEMAAGIVADPEALKILTDIYDYKTNPYKSRLRTGPCFNLDRIVFSMLAASNEAMLKGLFGVAEIQGGFLARIFLVVPNERRPPNSLMRLDQEAFDKSLMHVIELFNEIKTLKGEFKLSEEAIDEYESWYHPFKASYSASKEVSGITGRMHTHVIKLAMIIAANELRLNITKADMELAINECIVLLPNYNTFTMSHHKDESGQAGGTVVAELLAAPNHRLKRKELIRRHCLVIPNYAELLDKIIISLEQADYVQQIGTKEGIYIQLTPTCLEMLGDSGGRS
jgi:histone H3/H4